MFEAHFIRVACPQCDRPNRRSVRRVRARERIICKGCGHVIALDTPEGRMRIRKADDRRATLIARQRIMPDDTFA